MNENHTISILGTTPAREQIEVLIGSKSTRNSFCLIVQTSPPGGGPPPHSHEREDEVFSVLEGDYEFLDGDRWVPFHKGEYRYGLRGGMHTFRNSGSTDGQMLVLTTPGGLDDYFEAISPLALPQDLERLTDVSKMFGITFMPPGDPH